MASVALGVIGGGIGAVFGGVSGAALGWSIGVTLGGVLFPPRMEPQERGRLDDLRLSGSGSGVCTPQVYGRARVGGNLIWARPLREVKRETEEGGKGGPTQKVVTYSYFGSFAAAVCRGPVDRIRRIWAEDLLIYDVTKTPPTKFDLEIYLGTETQDPDPLMESFEGAGEVPAYRGLCYVVFDDLPLRKWANRIPVLTFEVENYQGGGNITLGAIMEDVFAQSGLEASEYDVSGATSVVSGFLIAQRQGAREILDSPLRVFATELVEVDGQIQAVARGGAAAGTIDAADLGTAAWEGGPPEPAVKLATKRMQDLELPARLDLTYFAAEKNYEQATQAAVRQTKEHIQEALTINTPLVMLRDTARRHAERLLYQQWAEREQYEVVLPPRYLKYAPGDVLTLPVGEDSVRTRIAAMEIGLFGPVGCSLVRDDAEILTQVVAGGDLGSITDNYADPTTVAFIAWSGNALRDEDADSVGFYVAAAGNEGWPGVQVFSSRTTNAYRVRTLIEDSVVYGEALTVLPAGTRTGAWDNTAVLDIELATGSVASTSVEDLLVGANTALVGNEVIQFLDVEILGVNQYRLSRLLRGQRGTDHAWATHAVGDRFVLLDRATVHRVEVHRDMIGRTLNLKARTEQQPLASVTPVSLLITGAELKPYSPAHIRGERDGSDNLTITWVRRARKNGEMRDGSDVELDEEHEKYRVEILDGGTVVRTLEVSAPTCTYSAGQQTADFGAAQSAVDVRIYQHGDFKRGTNVSRTLGYPGSATV